MNILNDPALRDLQPETEREGRLYAKAYFQGIDAALRSIEEHGIETTRALHQKMMEDLTRATNKRRLGNDHEN